MCGTMPFRHCPRSSESSSSLARGRSTTASPIALKAASQLHWCGYSAGAALVVTPMLLSLRMYAARVANGSSSSSHIIPVVDTSGFKDTAGAESRILLLRGGHDADGAPLDVLIEGEHIAAAGAGAASHPLARQARAVDMAGRTLLPAAAEPHAHLDKALLGGGAVNQDGTLVGALAAMETAPMTCDAILGRARRAAAIALRHGFTAIRSHVDVPRSGSSPASRP